MLVLSRKTGQKVVIGNEVTLTVVEVQGSRVVLGIDAPDHVRVLRAELLDRADEPMVVWTAAEEPENRELVPW